MKLVTRESGSWRRAGAWPGPSTRTWWSSQSVRSASESISASGKRRVVLTAALSMVACEHRSQLALRLEDELAYFARGAVPGRRRRNVMRAPPHLLGCFVRRAGEAAALEHRQIDEVVAHVGGRVLLQPDTAQQRAKGSVLVVGALDDMLDAKLARALGDRGRLAAANEPGLESAELQQLHAVAVEGMEGLQLLAAW